MKDIYLTTIIGKMMIKPSIKPPSSEEEEFEEESITDEDEAWLELGLVDF